METHSSNIPGQQKVYCTYEVFAYFLCLNVTIHEHSILKKVVACKGMLSKLGEPLLKFHGARVNSVFVCLDKLNLNIWCQNGGARVS